MNKYLVMALMALSFSGIIFSLIFLILLKNRHKVERKRIELKSNNILLEELDKFLKYGGYWLSLESWIGMQVLFALTGLVIALSSVGLINRLKNMSLVMLALEVILFIAGKAEIKKRNEVINADLCTLQETLFFQSDTGVEREDILRAVFDEFKDPFFKTTIKEVIFAYSLKQDVLEKIEKLKTISNNMNLIVFSNTLIQDFKIGESDENIEAQAVVTRRLISNRAIVERKASRFKMVIIGVLLSLMFIFLMVTPTLIEFTQDMNKIIG